MASTAAVETETGISIKMEKDDDTAEQSLSASTAEKRTTQYLPPENCGGSSKIIDEMKLDVETVCNLSHQEIMDVVKNSLREVLKDPLLCDLPSDVTSEEVNLQLALEYGQAMTVNVQKQNGEVLSVVVVQSGIVEDLKQAIKRHVTMKQKREGNAQPINWRYIWKTYWLAFQGQKLDDDNRKIKDYGIRNKDEVTFIKRLKVKGVGY